MINSVSMLLDNKVIKCASIKDALLEIFYKIDLNKNSAALVGSSYRNGRLRWIAQGVSPEIPLIHINIDPQLVHNRIEITKYCKVGLQEYLAFLKNKEGISIDLISPAYTCSVVNFKESSLEHHIIIYNDLNTLIKDIINLKKFEKELIKNNATNFYVTEKNKNTKLYN